MELPGVTVANVSGDITLAVVLPAVVFMLTVPLRSLGGAAVVNVKLLTTPVTL